MKCAIATDEPGMPAATAQWLSVGIFPEITAASFVMQAVVEPSNSCAVLSFCLTQTGKPYPKPIDIQGFHIFSGTTSKSIILR
jgi:hypothetical protein